MEGKTKYLSQEDFNKLCMHLDKATEISEKGVILSQRVKKTWFQGKDKNYGLPAISYRGDVFVGTPEER